MLFVIGHPLLHTIPSQNRWRTLYILQIFKQNSFKTYCIFTDLGTPQLWERGQVGGRGYLRAYWVPLTCMHACTHMDVHAKIYMYRNCKWLPSWVSCLACLTCVCMHMSINICMGHPPHTHTLTPRVPLK